MAGAEKKGKYSFLKHPIRTAKQGTVAAYLAKEAVRYAANADNLTDFLDEYSKLLEELKSEYGSIGKKLTGELRKGKLSKKQQKQFKELLEEQDKSPLYFMKKAKTIRRELEGEEEPEILDEAA